MGIAAAIAGAAVISGVTSVVSGNKAAKAQQQAADQSIAEQRRQYDQTRADQAPWRNVGAGALGKLGSLYGINPDGTASDPAKVSYDEFRNTPGYQFQLSEGTKAAEHSASARGLLASGATQKAVARYASGLADTTFEQYANHLAGLAGVGQTATQATSAAGQNAANNISNAYENAGQARASSYLNTGNAINGTLNNMASLYAFNAGGGFGSPGTSNAYGIKGSDGIY